MFNPILSCTSSGFFFFFPSPQAGWLGVTSVGVRPLKIMSYHFTLLWMLERTHEVRLSQSSEGWQLYTSRWAWNSVVAGLGRSHPQGGLHQHHGRRHSSGRGQAVEAQLASSSTGRKWAQPWASALNGAFPWSAKARGQPAAVLSSAWPGAQADNPWGGECF